MILKRLPLLGLAALLSFAATAQPTRTELRAYPDLAAGNYVNYPHPTENPTPAPEGYEPFYISHYGRHGARYMTSDSHFKYVLAKMDTAAMKGLLTDYGQDVLQRLNLAAEDARGRAGDLTELGGRQHRAIAYRMFRNHRSLLGRPVHVVANSSTSRRCMISMGNFCLELRALNPDLTIDMDASEHDMYYMLPNDSIVVPKNTRDSELYDELNDFRHKMLNGRHQFDTLFTDPGLARTFIDPYTFTDGLWNIAADMQCLPELNLSFLDLFGIDGMIDGHRSYNASWCLWEGLMPGARPSYYRIYPLLQNFLDEADKMIRSGESGVRLRFGHDSVVLPFAYVLGVREAVHATDDMEHLHETFSLFRLIPMAANVQWIFYRKPGSDDILVKFLMNESETTIPVRTDCWPYYHWKDVSAYYRDKIRDANLVYKKDGK